MRSWDRLEAKDWVKAAMPTFVCAAVIVPMNVFGWTEGPYPFLMVHRQLWYVSVIWAAVILGGVMLAAFVMEKFMLC